MGSVDGKNTRFSEGVARNHNFNKSQKCVRVFQSVLGFFYTVYKVVG